jgi:hypothetical protein
MVGMADLAELQGKQAEAAQYATRIGEEQDPQRVLEMAAEMQKKAAELEKMGRGIERALTPVETTGAAVEVALTSEQKERVTRQTGVGLESVTVHDSKRRMWSRDLPLGKVDPREIEKEAAKEAARLRLISETRRQVEGIVQQLEALNVPELAETIAELRRDPTLGRGRKAP